MIDELFPDRVTKTETCWLWARPRPDGYGQVWYQGRMWTAHRLSLVLAAGPLADDQVAMHICDNRDCVNPDHLRAGSVSDNVRDMYAKGRRTFTRRIPKSFAYTERTARLFR